MLMAKLEQVEGVEDLGEHHARYRTVNPAGEIAAMGTSESLTVK